MIPAINNDIDSLSTNFRIKFDLWRQEVIEKFPNAVVFEARRSQERQDWLYAQGRTRPWKIVTWTKTSNHFSGNAVDIVFRNDDKLQRVWPYWELIEIAKKYGIRNLSPKELCHFEDDWSPIKNQYIMSQLAKQAIGLWIRSWERPLDKATREEVAIMVQRMYNLIKK